ncbi:MAG: ATP-binding cassette domain-containing protein [Clostridia bacterium]|jgi:peptide/nickel transport system ATP-binding protein|nr:ATP-binding cassette domain-containing protein [Clostridia bacterium]
MLLEADGISFRYNKNSWILDNVHLKLHAGEVLGLSGPSGCGKTTLAQILAGYKRPHRGQVKLNGKPLPTKGYNPVQLVWQHPEKAVNPRWQMKKVLNERGPIDEELMKALGIEPDWLNRWPNELSGGELQRFCLARALGPETRFLIADEITTMLDPITQAQIWQVILQQVEKRKLGVLVISHEQPLLSRLCSRIITIA